MHFNREMPETDWTTVPLAPAVIRNIDEKTAKAINGDDGGAWTPSAPIEIDGAGMRALSAWQLTGGATIEASDAAPIEFGGDSDEDVFGYDAAHSGRTRSALTHLSEVYTAAPATLTFDAAYSCVQAKAKGARFLAPIRVLDGATISSVSFTIRVGQAHASVPAELPRFRVLRVDEDGNAEPLASGDADIDGWRYFAPKPSTGAAWYFGGNAQTFTYACNQNSEVDLSRYAYFAEVIEEQGNGAMTTPGNRFVSLTVECVSARLSGRE